ncbi:MAG: glycoside hydrolase domain-containing protein, partial [bacterium]
MNTCKNLCVLFISALVILISAYAHAVEIINGSSLLHTYVSYVANPDEAARRLKVNPGFRDPTVGWGYGISSPAPPTGWMMPGFDDSGWIRRPADFLGGYGENQDPTDMVVTRGRFTVADPNNIGAMKLQLSYRGGVVVYLNGEEIGRANLPAGDPIPGMLADEYPRSAFVTRDDDRLLPSIGTKAPPADIADRVAQRFRNYEIALPTTKLHTGVNILALVILPSKVPAALPATGGRTWNQIGLTKLTLTADNPEGITSSIEAPAGVQIWNANPLQIIGKGINFGDPNEPLSPIHLVAPRNGRASGQVVVSSPTALPVLAATIGEVTSAAGNAIPPTAFQLRYTDISKQYIPLLEQPIAGAKIQAIWVSLQLPADTMPGSYQGKITISGLKDPVQVPVEVTVIDWLAPKPQDWKMTVNLLQSPESVAGYYNVPLWSDEHFKLMEKSLALMGAAGNNLLGINTIGKTVFGNDPQVVFRKVGDVYQPDFAYLDRYLELYNKYGGAPRFLAVQVWDYSMYRNGRTRDGGDKEWQADTINAIELRDGKLLPLQLPMHGKPGSEELWKLVMDGINTRVQKLGWKRTKILLGTGGDNWPGPDTVKMFQRVAPYAQWRVITHGGGCPKWGPAEQERTQPNGMVVGFLEMARRTGNLRNWTWEVPVSSNARDHVSANPYDYREMPLLHTERCNFNGFSWKGLDYWSYTVPGGTQRNALTGYLGFGNVVGGTPRAILAPGPDGAVTTVQFEMLREGGQDTAAMIYLHEVINDPAK